MLTDFFCIIWKSLGVWRVNTLSKISAYFLSLFVWLASLKKMCTEDLKMKLNDDSDIQMKTVISAERNIVRETKINMSMCVNRWLLFQIITDFKGRPEGAQSSSHESLLFRFCLQKDKHLLVFLSPFLMLTRGRSCYCCNFGDFYKA